jgi:hypothetical protein
MTGGHHGRSDEQADLDDDQDVPGTTWTTIKTYSAEPTWKSTTTSSADPTQAPGMMSWA